MIRVLQVIGGLDRGGAETMIMNLYRAVDHDRVQFDFIVHSEKQDAYRKEIEQSGGRIYVFPQFVGKNIVQYKKVWEDFLSAHPEYQIVHSHVRSYASVYLPIARKHGLKTIVHSHSTSNGGGFKGKIKDFMQLPVRKQADFLFACSQVSGEWLFGKDATKQSNYFYVKNAIDVKSYLYDEAIRESMRSELQIQDNIVYGHVGRLSEPKNHSFLLDVFKEISKRQEKACLLITGDGELRSEIEQKIKVLELEDKVFLLGSRSDVPRVLQAIDCFLFPSLWEGLPVTVVEAQAAGLPCLVSDTVTKEVDVSDSVQYLPINNGVDVWVEHAINQNGKRYIEAYEDVILAGFDVHATAKWLTDFYYSQIV